MLCLAHLHLYLAVVRYLSLRYETAWIIVGISSIASSLAAPYMAALHTTSFCDHLRITLHRWGSCWNIFVLLTSAIMLLSRIFTEYRLLSFRGAFILSCCVSLAVCLYGMREAVTIRRAAFEIKTDKLPPHARIRVVQITDLHIGPFTFASFVDRIASEVKNTRPDLVTVTGDLVDGYAGDESGTFSFYENFAEKLRGLVSETSRMGVWAVPGNHDYYEGFANSEGFMARSGIKILRSQKVDLGPVVLLGADDLDHTKISESGVTKSEDLVDSLTEDERKKFVILLRHRPVVETSTIGRFDLQLSGHTHGGQLFPLPSSRHKIPGRHKGPLDLGRGSYLYVSNGAGFVGPPMRFFAPAEIVVIDLIGKSPAEK
jgi:predicted MPP superfamily phosphohydrolase